MSVKLYGMAGSPNVRGAMLGLAEKGVDYQLVNVAPPVKDPENMARNPFGRVPGFEHDGFMFYETQAILRYVDQVFPGPALQPTGAHQLARMVARPERWAAARIAPDVSECGTAGSSAAWSAAIGERWFMKKASGERKRASRPALSLRPHRFKTRPGQPLPLKPRR